MLKKTMVAMAGVAAGLSTTLAGSPAAATPSDPEIVRGPLPTPISASDVGAMAVCQEATQYNIAVGHFFIPSITRNGGDLTCTLAQGNFNNNGVYKLQDALRLCHGKAFVASDGDFGALTARGLREVTGSEVYNASFRQINWPIYNANGDFINRCYDVF